MPERSKGAGCKPAGDAFGGSNPSSRISTNIYNHLTKEGSYEYNELQL